MDLVTDYRSQAEKPLQSTELPYQPVGKRKRSADNYDPPSSAQHSHNNPFEAIPTQHAFLSLRELAQAWHHAWDDLTQDLTIDREEEKTEVDISLQVRALVDSHWWDPVVETERGASSRILNIIVEGSQMQQPHRPLGPREFRLLYWNPRETTEPLSYQLFNRTLPGRPEEIEYTAFSYCWSPRFQKRKVIFINGLPFIVSETLFDLLDQSRISKSDYFWIDALCIRQDEDDAADKSAQIPLMGSIYQKATWVDIWLGRDSDGVGVALNSLYEKGPQALLDPDCAEKIYAILQRAWFGRVWIIQELLLAQPDAPTLILGPFEIEWALFAEAVLQFEAMCTQHECFSVKLDGMGQYHRYGS